MAVRTQQEICVQSGHCAACFGARMRGEPFNHLYHRRSDQVFAAWPHPCETHSRSN